MIAAPMEDREGFRTVVAEVSVGVCQGEQRENRDWKRSLDMALNCRRLVSRLERMRSCSFWMSKDYGFLRWELLLVEML